MITENVDNTLHQLQIRTRRAVNDLLAGEYLSVFRGRGVEFDEVRAYEAGDDVRSIDWNVTARTGSPHIKRFIEERELTLYFVVDMSASGRFGSVEKTKHEAATELTALLAFSAVKNNDRVGLILFTEEVERFIPPSKGRSHVMRVLNELMTFEPKHAGTDLGAAMDYLNRVAAKRCVAFVVSDFQAAGFEDSMIVAARRHDVIAAVIGDRHERELPPVGLVQMRDAESGRVSVVDTSSDDVREGFQQAEEQHRQELHRFLDELDVDYLDIMTGEDHVAELHGFFRGRMRRGVQHG